MQEVKKNKKACEIYLDRNKEHDEMDLDYSIIEEKVKEFNDLGVDISLQEIGNIIESKFVGKFIEADLRRWPKGVYLGKLLHPQYTLIRKKGNISS